MIRDVILVFALAYSALMTAQEIKIIDLTDVQQRTELRRPAVPPAECTPEGSCVGAGYGGASVGDGAPDRRDPHALGVYLVRVTPAEIDPAKAFRVEFRVLNTGLAPIELPISPHLSDLQPSDASATFSYVSLALVVRLEGGQRYLALIELYSSPDHEGSTLVLKPGEWITVRAKLKFSSYPSAPVSTSLRGEFWLRRNTFHPHPGGSFLEVENLYPNATPTPGIPVHLIHSENSDAPK